MGFNSGFKGLNMFVGISRGRQVLDPCFYKAASKMRADLYDGPNNKVYDVFIKILVPNHDAWLPFFFFFLLAA